MTIYSAKTKSGFDQRVFVMYKGVKSGEFSKVMTQGLPFDSVGKLGPGYYLTRSFPEALRQGDVVLKLFVHPGLCKKARPETGGDQTSGNWQENFTGAWLANTDNGQRSELNCIRSVKQAMIVGVCKNFRKVPENGKNLADRCSSHPVRLDRGERAKLDKFLTDRAIKYEY